MKKSLNLLFGDNIIKIATVGSLVSIVLQLLLLVLVFSKLPPLIPLLNSQPWGEARLYPSVFILALPPFIILIFLVNNILSAYFYKRNTLIARILAFNSFLFSFLAAVAFIQIILLVF